MLFCIFYKKNNFNSLQFQQKHAILMETSTLKELPDALATPFPEMLYIQAKVAKLKVSVIVSIFEENSSVTVNFFLF